MILTLLIPFIYFARTRLNSRAILFHFFFEWVPIVWLAYSSSLDTFFTELLVGYLAFISVYELGYLLNDQLANYQTHGRKRVKVFSKLESFCFVVVRLSSFLAITFYLDKTTDYRWWIWYVLLLMIFGIHSILNQDRLKIITFSYLAFARFFSPIILLVGLANINWVLPVFLHYVLFRTITYMDSKDLIRFDRNSNLFRVIFHIICGAFSVSLAVLNESYVPLWISGYYIFIVGGFAMADTYLDRVTKTKLKK
ncbi:MAG: hypothetical protein R2820_08810 [Cyclobacteriaceae bacterium]|nr:hypothetical protein [Cyclobacteriaceae bacterium]